MAKTPHFQWGGLRFTPWWRAKTPHAAGPDSVLWWFDEQIYKRGNYCVFADSWGRFTLVPCVFPPLEHTGYFLIAKAVKIRGRNKMSLFAPL